jgi:hypothetical protein
MKQSAIPLRTLAGLVIACLILSHQTHAAGTNKIGTSAATFLRIPVGARAIGMGSSFVSMMNDPSGLYWNPSLISSVKSNAFLADHSPWLPGITFDYLGVIVPFEDFGTVGLSATILQTDEMEVTTPAQQMGTGETFRASSLALGFSYSRSLTDRFAIGGTFKYIRETIYNSNATAVGFDIGTVYLTPFLGIRLGASIANFGTKLRMDGDDLNIRADVAPDQEGNNQSVVARLNTDQFDLPLVMRVGISGEAIANEDVRLTLSADAVNPNDNAASMNAGAECAFLNETLRLRVGYRDVFLDQSEFGLSWGVSVNNIRLVGDVLITAEYGYQKYVHLGNSNRFTLGIRF